MYLEAQLLAGSAAEDAWDAVYNKGKEKNFGTSEQDVHDYAAAGGAAGAAAACVGFGGPVGAAASPLCAEGGAIVAGFISDTIYSIGASLFGGGGDLEPNDIWNPVADHAIAGIVKAFRIKNGLSASNPPGGSARNWPEWHDVAVIWAGHVNDYVASQGGKIKWFYDSPSDKDPGRIRGAAVDKWEQCGLDQLRGAPLDDVCKSGGGQFLSKAAVIATQQTMTEVVQQGRVTPSTTTSTVVKVAGGAAVLGLLWYFRQPIVAFATKIKA